MIYPTIHLNGTSKGELLDQLCTAGSAVGDAIRALHDAAPNARDYYPQGPSAIGMAINEHSGRIAALVRVSEELDAIALHIDT